MWDSDLAELYALVHRGNPGDLAFYRQACEGADSILELGCGYGRVLAHLAPFSDRIVGLDREPGLLELAQNRIRDLPGDVARKLTLVRGDMRCFAFARRFDRVLIPFNGIYCLLSPEECVRCIDLVAQHLEPDGELIFDIYAADVFHYGAEAPQLDEAPQPDEAPQSDGAPQPDEDHDEPIVSVDWNGALYDVSERSRWDREAQRLDVEYRYRSSHEHDANDRTLSIGHRYWLRDELEPLLGTAGLRLLSVAGGYDGEPADLSAEQLVIRAGPAAP